MPTGARTATRVRKTRTDKLSPTSTTAAEEIELRGLIILPRQSYEQGQGWVTIEGWDIYVLPSSRVIPSAAQPTVTRAYADGDVLASDLLRIDGTTWQVDGPPAPYDKGTTRKATLIKVTRVGGGS